MAEKMTENALSIDTVERNFKKLSTSSTAKGSNEKGHPMELRTTVGKVFSDESTDSDDTFVSSILLLLRGNDDTPNIKKYKKNSSELTRRFVRTSFHVEFRQADFFKHNCSTVQDYLEELLQFSLSNSNRKKPDEDTGKNLYDDGNVDDIIHHFRGTVPCIDWLFKHFNVDYDIWSMRDRQQFYQTMINRPAELDAISMENKFKMTFDENIKLWNERKALNFAISLDNTLRELGQKFKRKSTVFDKKHELVKQLFGEIGALVDAKTRHNGSTKFFTKVFIDKNAEKNPAEEVEVIEVEITTQPDYMFVNDLQSVAFIPVEVYAKAGRSCPPIVPSSSSGLDFSCIASLNLSNNQIGHLKQKMEAQHVMQLIAALHDKVKNELRLYKPTDKLSEVGIFVVNENVFLSKITTTPLYLDLFTRDIFKKQSIGKYPHDFLASSDKYFTIEYTNWSINLRKAAQRHALIIFLAHMMHTTC